MAIVRYSFEYRFVDPQAIKDAFIKKILKDNPKIDQATFMYDKWQVLQAYRSFFKDAGVIGWEYCGEANYIDLPFRGLHVFKRKIGRAEEETKELKESEKQQTKDLEKTAKSLRTD